MYALNNGNTDYLANIICAMYIHLRTDPEDLKHMQCILVFINTVK